VWYEKDMEIKKEQIYHQNAFLLLLLKVIGVDSESIGRMRILATFTIAGIKAAFKIAFAHKSEFKQRDDCWRAFHDCLYELSKKGIK
jgi:hypothetical protein